MNEAYKLADRLVKRAIGKSRYMVAIAGPPGSGKSTLAASLRESLLASGQTAVVVPMDGFHFDDIILNARGHRPRKGAPFTYDVAGFAHLLTRIKAGEDQIAIPVFDRTLELSRAAADLVVAETKFVLVEGNYLLLNQAPWDDLYKLFDITVQIKEPYEVLEQRLIDRWRGLGFDLAYAKNWIASNDGPNIMTVLTSSRAGDITMDRQSHTI